jgi:hypothetical protein
MNKYIMIRRLRWPAILLLAGIVALLDQMGAIDHFWHLFIPLLLILLGVMLLAERAALAAEGGYPPYPGAPYSGAPYQGAPASYPGAADQNSMAGSGATPYAPAPGTAIVPAPAHEIDKFDKFSDGGHS